MPPRPRWTSSEAWCNEACNVVFGDGRAKTAILTATLVRALLPGYSTTDTFLDSPIVAQGGRMNPRKKKRGGRRRPAAGGRGVDSAGAAGAEPAAEVSEIDERVEEEQVTDEAGATGQTGIEEQEPAAADAAAEEQSPEAIIAQLQRDVEALRDRHLRTAAEYDNFRRRTAKERAQMWKRAQGEVVTLMLDALDDFGRVLEVDPESTSAEDVIKGVELVERKLLRELETAGLERVGEVGETFDPNHHEAIGSLPAASEEQDHTVGAVLQIGYKFGGALLRPARVQVLMWQGDGSPQVE